MLFTPRRSPGSYGTLPGDPRALKNALYAPIARPPSEDRTESVHSKVLGLMELTLTKRPSNTAHRGGLIPKGRAQARARDLYMEYAAYIYMGGKGKGVNPHRQLPLPSLSPFPLIGIPSLTLTAYAPQLSSRLVAPHGASNLSFTYTDTHVTIQLCSCCIWSPHLTT